MEILLLQDIAGVGKKNDLLVVGNGFALNYLLPNRMALVATPTVRRRYAEQIKKRAEEKERERQIKMQAAAALAGKSVMFAKKVTKTGKLYAGVTAEQIADAIQTQIGFSIAADMIVLDAPIKATGTFTVPIKMGDIMQNISVIVTEQK